MLKEHNVPQSTITFEGLNKPLSSVETCDGGTCRTGGLCSVVVAVTVVWTVEHCLIMVVGVTGRASREAPGACGDMHSFSDGESPIFVFVNYFKAGYKKEHLVN